MKLDWTKILAYVPEARRAAVREIIERDYSDVVTTNHPVVEDDSRARVLRFRPDPMICWLRSQISLDAMCVAYQNREHGAWSRKKVKDFYRGMGYSLCGFSEVFHGVSSWAKSP